MLESEFYGTVCSGAGFNKKEGDFFSEENINFVKKEYLIIVKEWI